jgi:DNA-directed RNA polymerase I subunit RPA12
MPKTAAPFEVDVDFCPACGALLPGLPAYGNVYCLACNYEVPIEKFASKTIAYSVVFNKRENFLGKKRGDDEDDELDGPTVERTCPKCGHDVMSYATLQLRSADEGETVFYTCVKCKFKETE